MGSLDDKLLDDKLREASAVWPSVHVSAELFNAAVESAVDAGIPLEDLHVADLYLAVGCLAGHPEAVATFERHVLGAVRPAVQRASRDRASAEDALQSTVEKLFVGQPPSLPKLAQYMGRGPLVSWVRVVAVREALQASRLLKRELLSDDASLVAGVSSAASVEMTMLRDLHADAFRAAVQQALRRLTSEQRTLLRFHVKDRLTIDQLAPMLGVHRATAARRLEKAREDALNHTREILCAEHGLSESEARSLCIALGSEIDVSIGRALESAAP